MELRIQAMESLIRHIAVPQAETDIFATAELEDRVTLWSLRDRRKLTEIRTVLDFGATRLAMVQHLGSCLLIAASFEGPVNGYDLEGSVLWSRKDLVGAQHLTPIPNGPEPMIGVGSEGEPHRVLGALDGKEITARDGIKKMYSSLSTAKILAITSNSAICLAGLSSVPLWQQSLVSFAVLHGGLSSRQVAYCEAAGAMYCFDLAGTHKWTLKPDKNRHFLRLTWNQATGRWMAVDWDYENGGSKRLLEISEAGNAALIADLGEPSETEFFATGDRLITSNGDIFDTHSGQVIWNFLKE
jgi:hypothetical protein